MTAVGVGVWRAVGCSAKDRTDDTQEAVLRGTEGERHTFREKYKTTFL